uniref:Ribosomal protein L27 n=1 Tax=Lotharella vacuolata TaxID=74820 RepID=A0A0H5BQV4_9EUKA|nr:ribosomal protein L27 [Lotharella vacuolata]BAS01604.1 ribosomal protein L27 [Lotharella vacuolata]
MTALLVLLILYFYSHGNERSKGNIISVYKGNLILLNTGRFAGKYAFILSISDNSIDPEDKSYRYFLICLIKKHKKKGKLNKTYMYRTKYKTELRFININHGLIINRKVPRPLISEYLSEMVGHKLIRDIYIEKYHHLVQKNFKYIDTKTLQLLL